MRPKFSERFGYTAAKPVQVEGMDRDLSVSFWNALNYYRDHIQRTDRLNWPFFSQKLRTQIWTRFLKQPVDELRKGEQAGAQLCACVKKWFLATAQNWYDAYELIEFVATVPRKDESSDFLASCVNKELEDENAGYRFVGGRFAPVTNEAELQAVRDALNSKTTALAPVGMHIQKALDLLSEKLNPDFRNSMKESISAVESVCKLITGLGKATLGPALDKTAKELDLNDHLRDGFKKIYGYTSDDHGIRHGLKNEEHPD